MKLSWNEKKIIRNTKYKALVKYNQEMGSKEYWIINQILTATSENAPINAIYKSSNSDWIIDETYS